MEIDDFAGLSVLCPNGMTVLHSDFSADSQHFCPGAKKKKRKNFSADLRRWRNFSIHAHPPVSVRIAKMGDIPALRWCPGVVLPLCFSLPIFYKQPYRILPIWNVFQCDFCVLAEMSGMDVN